MSAEDIVRVLAVDDHEDALALIRENLELRGAFRVTTATDGDGAIERLKGDLPHIVVLDFRLNGPSTGLEVLKRIRLHDKFIPVVLYSGLADAEDKAELIHERITFILEKGTRADALPELLKRIVREKNEIIAALEAWADGNSTADEPAFTLSDGATMTMRAALVEMKKCTPLGRELIEQYREGVTEIFATAGAGGRRASGAKGGG